MACGHLIGLPWNRWPDCRGTGGRIPWNAQIRPHPGESMNACTHVFPRTGQRSQSRIQKLPGRGRTGKRALGPSPARAPAWMRAFRSSPARPVARSCGCRSRAAGRMPLGTGEWPATWEQWDLAPRIVVRRASVRASSPQQVARPGKTSCRRGKMSPDAGRRPARR